MPIYDNIPVPGAVVHGDGPPAAQDDDEAGRFVQGRGDGSANHNSLLGELQSYVPWNHILPGEEIFKEHLFFNPIDDASNKQTKRNYWTNWVAGAVFVTGVITTIYRFGYGFDDSLNDHHADSVKWGGQSIFWAGNAIIAVFGGIFAWRYLSEKLAIMMRRSEKYVKLYKDFRNGYIKKKHLTTDYFKITEIIDQLKTLESYSVHGLAKYNRLIIEYNNLINEFDRIYNHNQPSTLCLPLCSEVSVHLLPGLISDTIQTLRSHLLSAKFKQVNSQIILHVRTNILDYANQAVLNPCSLKFRDNVEDMVEKNSHVHSLMICAIGEIANCEQNPVTSPYLTGARILEEIQQEPIKQALKCYWSSSDYNPFPHPYEISYENIAKKIILMLNDRVPGLLLRGCPWPTESYLLKILPELPAVDIPAPPPPNDCLMTSRASGVFRQKYISRPRTSMAPSDYCSAGVTYRSPRFDLG